MGGLFDIYVLSRDRSKGSVVRFLDHFLPRRTEAADDYIVPKHADRPELCFDDAGDLLAYLERHTNEPHAIYWTSEAPGDPRSAMVFPTVDGRMVYGLSVEGSERRFLADLMAFLKSAEGYIAFETPPPDDPAAFEDAVLKFNQASCQRPSRG